VIEASDKEPLAGGHVYLAPADYHLLVDDGCLALSVDARVYHARPSVDVLFESAAEAYRDGVLGVLLTGASADGTAGALRIKQRGGTMVAQDPRTAESPIMPGAAISAGAVDHVLPLDEIAPYLNVVGTPRR
jgi:two-component system chemotaxis response regulator CheB